MEGLKVKRFAVEAVGEGALCRGELGGQDAYKGTFACAVGTCDEEACACLQVEIDVTEDPVAVELFAQASGFQFNHCPCRCLS